MRTRPTAVLKGNSLKIFSFHFWRFQSNYFVKSLSTTAHDFSDVMACVMWVSMQVITVEGPLALTHPLHEWLNGAIWYSL